MKICHTPSKGERLDEAQTNKPVHPWIASGQTGLGVCFSERNLALGQLLTQPGQDFVGNSPALLHMGKAGENELPEP